MFAGYPDKKLSTENLWKPYITATTVAKYLLAIYLKDMETNTVAEVHFLNLGSKPEKNTERGTLIFPFQVGFTEMTHY